MSHAIELTLFLWHMPNDATEGWPNTALCEIFKML